MEIEKHLDKRPIIIKVDNDLDKYLEMDLFRVKVDKANYVLKTVGLPKFGCNKKNEILAKKKIRKNNLLI